MSGAVAGPRRPIPLRARKLDILFIVFFAINFGFITYIVDLEQLVIDDPSDFDYPVWPPPPFVDLIHWWGRNFDPVLLARPPWWRATIWIDNLLFGPFYAFATYAYARGREWIRIPSFLWAAVIMTNVTIILFEEMIGPHATPERAIVLLANAPWFLVPAAVIARMWRSPHPFTRDPEPPEPAK
jgi:hypothetical protein